MGVSSVNRAVLRIASLLRELDVEFAVAGALALAAHGHVRATVDVDVLVSREGLEKFKGRWLGRGYAERFPGSRGSKDTENNVPIDCLLSAALSAPAHEQALSLGGSCG